MRQENQTCIYLTLWYFLQMYSDGGGGGGGGGGEFIATLSSTPQNLMGEKEKKNH